MGACDFSAVFSEICSSMIAGDSVSQVEIYSLMFDNYYLMHKDDATLLDKSDINKRKQGKMNAHSGIIKYYCQDPEALAYDIETNIIPLISDKYALRDTFINMVKCDSCSEEKKADTLSNTDDLPQFLQMLSYIHLATTPFRKIFSRHFGQDNFFCSQALQSIFRQKKRA